MSETILTAARVDEIERAVEVYVVPPGLSCDEARALVATIREQQARITALESERDEARADALDWRENYRRARQPSPEDAEAMEIIRRAAALLKGETARNRAVREDLCIESGAGLTATMEPQPEPREG